jgi:hypothetical protein
MNTPRDPWWIGVALRIQALLLMLTPRHYRQRFGVELRQVLRDRLRELPRRPVWQQPVELASLAWQGLLATATLQRDALVRWPLRLQLLLLALACLLGSLLLVGREPLIRSVDAAAKSVGHGLLLARVMMPAEHWLEAQRDLADRLQQSGAAADAALAGLSLRHARAFGTWGLPGAGGETARRVDASLHERAADRLSSMRRQGERLLAEAGQSASATALWLGYLYCDSPCRRDEVIARWLRVAPDNGYPQLLRLLELPASSDAERVDAVLLAIIEAPRYRSPHGEAYRRLGEVAATLQPGWSLHGMNIVDGIEVQPALAAHAIFPLALPRLQQLAEHCSPALATPGSLRLVLCDTALRRIADDSSEPVEQLIALKQRARLQGENSAAHRAYRDAAFLLLAGAQDAAGEIRAILAGEPLLGHRRERRQALGLAVVAPSTFRDRLRE